jgi:hypothetical protein
MLRRLGERHEEEHPATLGTYVDLNGIPEADRLVRIRQAITSGSAVL